MKFKEFILITQFSSLLALGSNNTSSSEHVDTEHLQATEVRTLEQVAILRKTIELNTRNYLTKLEVDRKDSLSFLQLKKMIETFDCEKPAQNQNLEFNILFQSLNSKKSLVACLEMQKFRRDNFRLAYKNTYSSESVIKNCNFIRNLDLFIEYYWLQKDPSFKISTAMNLLIINDSKMALVGNEVVGLTKGIEGRRPASKRIFESIEKSTLQDIIYPQGRFFLFVLASERQDNEEKITTLKKFELELGYLYESTLAEDRTLRPNPEDNGATLLKIPPSEVKANLSKYLLKPGSYYDMLITDYANIPEPKPEKKP